MALRGLKITWVCIAILFISCSIILSFKFKNSTFLLFPKHFSVCFYIPANRWYSKNKCQNLKICKRWMCGCVLILFQPVLHHWFNKGCGMCYPVSGIVHIKEPLLLIGKSSSCGGSGFPLYLSGPLPYVRLHITINKMCWGCR